MSDVPAQFKLDALTGFTSIELAEKYSVSQRTVFNWKAKLRNAGKLPPIGTPLDQIVDWDVDGNQATAVATKETIRTLEQLIEACQIDLEEWVIVDSGFKKWDVGAKLKTGSLKWKDGKIVDGDLEYGGIGAKDLYSVWARCTRRNPVAITPTIRPIECPVTYKVKEIERPAVLSSLVWTDPQFGYNWEGNRLVAYHDREVLDLWLQIAAWLQPARIDILGDWFDAPGFSMFLQDPSTYNTFQPAISESHWWLRQTRIACPNSKITIHPGNHDERIRKALLKHLPVAYGIKPADELDLPPSLHPARLLALHNLDIDWLTEYPNDEDWLGDTIRLNHGIWYSTKSGATTAKAVNEEDVCTISGHNHRSEHASRTRHTRQGPVTNMAYSIGCTCKIDGTVPAKHKYMNWQQSAALVQFTNTHHAFNVIPVTTASPKQAIVDGRLFQSTDRTQDLADDLPDFNW